MPDFPDSTVTPLSGKRHRCPARLDVLEGLRLSFSVFLQEHGVREADISSWILVMTEAAANAIKHGCAGQKGAEIVLSWEASDGEISLAVADPGPGPDESLTREPCLPSDPFALNGRGLFLIRSFADRWEHWRSSEGYRLVIRKQHPGMPGPDMLAALLENTVEELTNSYENLSAFYRLGDGLARAENLLDFIQRALQDLKRTVSNNYLSLSFAPGILEAIGGDFERERAIRPLHTLGPAQKRALRTETEYIWERKEEVATDSVLAAYGSGVCSPIQAGGSTRGIMTVARKDPHMFNSGELNTVRTFADIMGIAVLNARNTVARSREARALRELEIASEIQKTLLPLPKVEPDPRWRLTSRREGAREVAGDYVGFERSQNGDLYLVIVDVMGKGVSASFLAGMFRTAFNLSLSFQYSPVGLMVALNRTLLAQLGDLTMFATCALARVPANRAHIEVVNAGHCPAVLSRADGNLEQVPSSGPPLGLFADATYAVQTLPLQAGDKLFLVTDGLYEWHEDGMAWGWEAFLDFLAAHRELPGEEVWDFLNKRIANSAEGEEPSDDRTFLAWEFLG